MNIHIETDHLIIRDLEETDVEGIFALDSDPEVHRYLGNQPIDTMEEAKKSIRYIRQQYLDNGIGRWAIIDKKTNDFVGWTGLKYEENLRKEFSYYDLGYRLRKKYWGQGIGYQTATASLKYGFDRLNLSEICAAADIDNQASNRILRKVGLEFVEVFEYEGILHNWYKLTQADFRLKAR
jgi:ribosomal-protein-alanine N-acetyltransferase